MNRVKVVFCVFIPKLVVHFTNTSLNCSITINTKYQIEKISGFKLFETTDEEYSGKTIIFNLHC